MKDKGYSFQNENTHTHIEIKENSFHNQKKKMRADVISQFTP